MAVSSRTYGVISAVVTGVGFIALILSFASDKWLEASNFEDVGFSNLGLWSICFDGKYRPPSFAAVSREYEGCWWALNKELDDLRSFLFPEWFVSTQALVTVGLILVIFVVIMQVINFINCFPHSAYKQTIKRGLALASGLLLFIAAILLCVAVILFGARATSTRTWLQQNDNNYLSWSYGMCILADFLFIIAGMCLTLQFLRLRGEKSDPDDGDPKVILTNEPPPGTSYRYTPGNNAAMSAVPPSQPAYAQRYAKNQNSRPLPHGPDSTFAVSGAGEVYINRLADYDERRNGDYRDGYKEQGRQGRPPWHQPKTNANTNTDTKKSLTDLDTSIDGTYMGSDYEKSKNIVHPTLPEYTPRSERKAKQNLKDTAASDSDSQDIVDKNRKKTKKKDDKSTKGERKSRSDSKKKRSGSRDRSRSGSRSRRKNASESEYSDESTKKRSRRRSRSRSRDDSDDGRSRRRSKRKTSSNGSKKRRRSRSRSKSKDFNTTCSDSLDSDSGSVRSRSRRKHKDDISRKDKKRQSSSSKKSRKKSRDGNISDDKLGSEYSHRSRRKDRDYSDVDSKKRMRDFSETESMRSGRSRHKPKGTYSSYYE